MGIEENKAVASGFFTRINAKDIAGALEMMAEDATWRLPGKPELAPVAGVRSKAEIARMFHGMFRQLKDGLKMTLKSVIGEGDKVALEAESYGELQNDRIYNNEYHFSMTIRDGKISAVHEYYDTQHAFATWFER
jgi:ketosteroid isomerase-like protein